MNNPFTRNVFVFDGSGSAGTLITEPNAANVFYFTLKVLYGSFISEELPPVETTLVTPKLPSNVNPVATLYDGLEPVAAMKLIAKEDYMSGNSALGAIYTFTTPSLSEGEFHVNWQSPEYNVTYGKDMIKLPVMSGQSNTFSAASLPSDVLAVAGVVDPQLVDDSTVNTGYIDMQAFGEAMFVFFIGATDITVDAIVRESEDTSDGGGQTLKDATQLTASDDNKQVIINIKATELSAGYRYLRGQVVVGNGTTGAQVTCVAIGLQPVAGLGSDNNVATVAQVVA